MRRLFLVLSIVCSMWSAASAGDYEEGYFWIVGSVQAKPIESYTYRSFELERRKVLERYRTRCGLEDFRVWHSHFMSNMKPNVWVVYTVVGDSKEETISMVGQDSCSKKGYLKKGSVLYTGQWLYCTSNPSACE